MWATHLTAVDGRASLKPIKGIGSENECRTHTVKLGSEKVKAL